MSGIFYASESLIFKLRYTPDGRTQVPSETIKRLLMFYDFQSKIVYFIRLIKDKIVCGCLISLASDIRFTMSSVV